MIMALPLGDIERLWSEFEVLHLNTIRRLQSVIVALPLGAIGRLWSVTVALSLCTT